MIEIISGTNRHDSNSILIATLYSARLKKLGIASGVIDLIHLPKDFIGSALYENAGRNEEFNVFRERMLRAEKYIFIVPEYNGSFPGVLKTFIDGLEFPNTFKEKKAALVGLSSGTQGGGPALSHLTDILNYCGTHVLAQKPRLAKIDSYVDGENLQNSLYHQLLDEQIQEFIKF